MFILIITKTIHTLHHSSPFSGSGQEGVEGLREVEYGDGALGDVALARTPPPFGLPGPFESWPIPQIILTVPNLFFSFVKVFEAMIRISA